MRRAKRLVALVALALVGSIVQSPHAAASSDNSTGDFSVTASDGTPLQARILYPSGTKPTGGWPLILYLHGGGSGRCHSDDSYTRAQLMADGYAVVTFNGRGHPAGFGATIIDSGASGCNPTTDGLDSLNDSGLDVAGPIDRQDMKDVITGALAWSSAGCSSPCTNSSKIGVMGFSYGGTRAWTMGIPGVDSRVKAIVPMAAGMFQSLPTSDMSNRPFAHQTSWLSPALDEGKLGAAHPSVFDAFTELNRSEFNNTAVPSTNTNGSVSSGTPTTLTISGSPSFTSADVGKPITVASAVEAGAVDRTLETTIAGYVNSTTVTLANAATSFGSGKRVSWGTQAWWDIRTIVDNNADVDKAHLITTPTFVVNGFLDNVSGYNGVSLPAAVSAWLKIPSTTPKFMYLGSCGHADPSCDPGTANQARLRAAVKRFLDYYVKGSTGTSVCASAPPCVMYAIPPTTPTSGDWGTLTETTTWPPPGATTQTFYLHGLASEPGTITTAIPSGSDVDSKTISVGQYGLPIADMCTPRAYQTGEYRSYVSGPAPAGGARAAAIEADIVLSSSSSRSQVAVDLYDYYDPPGATPPVYQRIWYGSGINVPYLRNGTAGTKYHFNFQPGDAGWTLAEGHSLWINVTSNVRFQKYQEPLPSTATYTIWHSKSDSSARSYLKVWWV